MSRDLTGRVGARDRDHVAMRSRVWLIPVLAVLLLVSMAPPAIASSVIGHGSREKHQVALTFDDGWSADRCEQIASTLRAYHVPATFFINGIYLRQARARWRRILKGFPIANHTYSHAWLDRLSRSGIRREISRNEAVIEQALGRSMLHLLRPPYGAYDGDVLAVADSLGYRTLLWDVDSGDTSPAPTTASVISAATRGVNGSIVLLHCGPSVTPAAVAPVIRAYRARGFTFVDLPTMLGSRRRPTACHVRDVDSGLISRSFQVAVRAAAPGDHLVLRGTCRGTSRVGKRLTVEAVQTKRSGTPTLAGMGHGPVLTVAPGTRLELVGLTIRGGAALRGGGIANQGRLTLRNVIVRGNKATVGGGGVINTGQLTLRGTTAVRSNRSAGRAAGILNGGTLTMAGQSRVFNNTAAVVGGGIVNTGHLIAVTCGGNVHSNAPDDCFGAP
jgi:peptidoglycan/xylan/chitin deacetylase (PgdA/CDA1 family)